MILVTGAAGFIGQHLVRSLAEEHGEKVIGLDVAEMRDPHITLAVRGDISKESEMDLVMESIKGLEVSAAIHLAAVASPPIAQRDPARAWATNVQGTHNVLQLLHRLECKKIVFFSSAHVYGISPRYMPTDENHPLALHDTYTTTKIAGEQLCKLFYENHGIAHATLRLWNAYGPGQNEDYFLGKKIKQARSGHLTIRNENVTKDWVHVSDVVKAAVMAMRSAYVGPLNVGTGIETSLGEIVGEIASTFGLDVVREDVPDEGPTRMLCDWRRIKNTLGWSPAVDFKRGLQELITP